ncbi:MAG: phenylalanine--tRNA ligase subunit beta [Sphingomonadaceae bacterium]
MKVLLSWLQEFVEVRPSVRELAHLLSMSGSEVAAFEEVGAHWSKVFVGQVVRLGPHPAAERLTLVEVNLGGSVATLVTAATNLTEGDKVPVVLAGGSLQPGSTIDAVDFRGIRSEGMLCSGLELGISPDGEGIYVMEPEAPVGTELKEYLNDWVIDIDVTPNRPDCMSVVGIAREVAALTGARLSIPPTRIPGSEFRSSDLITVEIRDPDLCPRYTAIVIRDVTVKPSPHWMQRRLYLCGVRPISNIVDATNYVMLERGQPLHAFDGSKLHDGIVVRRAAPGEAITTLDGETRRLTPDTLVIADHQEAVAIAGVMGGLLSEVDDSTRLVVLESANFDRTSIRRTTQQLRLSTEASKRFDKGLDPELTVPSALRAAALMVELGGGSVGQDVVDVYPNPIKPTVLSISEQDVARLLGLPIGRAEMRSIFDSLGFQTAELDVRMEVVVPTFRQDVEGKADLCEELARIKGYDLIPSTLPSGALPEALPEPYLIWERVARDILVGAGLQEVITYALVDCDSPSRLTVEVGPDVAEVPPESIRLKNAMTPEQACLRTSMLGSLMRTIAANMRHETRAYIFELGRVYLPPLDPLPVERRTLGIAFTGPREAESWNSHPEDGDFFDLKGYVEALLRALGIEGATYEPARHTSLHPGRTARLAVDGRVVGYLGEVHPTVVERYDLQPRRVFAAELDFETLITLASPERTYHALPRFPAVSHDIAVVLDEAVPNAEVEAVIRQAGSPLLATVQLFDLYRGPSIPEGKKSLAYALAYRASDRTLTDQEVAEVEARIVEDLASRFGAYLRGK